MSNLLSLADLLRQLLNEDELSGLFLRLDKTGQLSAALPAGKVSLQGLYVEAAQILDRRGRIDAVLFQALADRAGSRLPEVAKVARAYHVQEPVAREPACVDARSSPDAPPVGLSPPVVPSNTATPMKYLFSIGLPTVVFSSLALYVVVASERPDVAAASPLTLKLAHEPPARVFPSTISIPERPLPLALSSLSVGNVGCIGPSEGKTCIGTLAGSISEDARVKAKGDQSTMTFQRHPDGRVSVSMNVSVDEFTVGPADSPPANSAAQPRKSR